ncbi:GNAT family N-acetyltransferase [Burkholderia cenocepacia]|uniref:GNAT family N-acetyltransferase n=1 Tax=Burkholderia cenocepacia TaxID=95486 RepID=UPI002AB71F3E|nr:GNAT family N-acetyltransferase [Burkholderia cenocepacia]
MQAGRHMTRRHGFNRRVMPAIRLAWSMHDEEMMLQPDETRIESNRLWLTPFSAKDADASLACITPSLTRYMGWDPPANRESFDRIWQTWLHAQTDGTDYVFVIRQRDGGSFLGLVGVHHVKQAIPELGVWIREDRHREGIGREAVRLVVEWACSTLNVQRFNYPVAEENHPSRRIAESLGGTVTGHSETPKFVSVIYQIPAPVTCESPGQA